MNSFLLYFNACKADYMMSRINMITSFPMCSLRRGWRGEHFLDRKQRIYLSDVRGKTKCLSLPMNLSVTECINEGFQFNESRSKFI